MVWGDDWGKNHFILASELARTGKLPEVALASEICAITSTAEETERFDNMRVCAATRSAQKGPDVWCTLFKSLLTSSKALPAGSPPLLRAGLDRVIVVDLHVHAGDHALGSALLSDGGPLMTHVMAKFKEKKSIQSIEWSQKRVGAYLASKWLKHELKLYTREGAAAAPISADVTVLTEDDKAYLKSVAGAWEAYEGTTQWQSKLRVCCLMGSQVCLQGSLKCDFAHAPPSMKQKFEDLEKAFMEKYGSMMVGKITAVRGDANVGVSAADHRPNTSAPPAGAEGQTSDAQPVALAGPESEAILRQQFTITADVKTFDNRGVSLLVAENGHAFILSKEDVILKKGTKLGGLGSGRMSQEEGDRSIKLEFPDGDRCWIEAGVLGISFIFCGFGFDRCCFLPSENNMKTVACRCWETPTAVQTTSQAKSRKARSM